MKNEVLNILNSYLTIFPNEKERQSKLKEFLEQHNYTQIIDWNNFDGHIVASGIIYTKNERKFLVLWHNDLKMFIYPGGHIDINDKSILEAAKREVKEETGLNNFKGLKITENELMPIDIATHRVCYNERLKLPEHYHFDFRYIFSIDNISNIKIDTDESSDYKWVDMDNLSDILHYDEIIKKIEKIIE